MATTIETEKHYDKELDEEPLLRSRGRPEADEISVLSLEISENATLSLSRSASRLSARLLIYRTRRLLRIRKVSNKLTAEIVSLAAISSW